MMFWGACRTSTSGFALEASHATKLVRLLFRACVPRKNARLFALTLFCGVFAFAFTEAHAQSRPPDVAEAAGDASVPEPGRDAGYALCVPGESDVREELPSFRCYLRSDTARRNNSEIEVVEALPATFLRPHEGEDELLSPDLDYPYGYESLSGMAAVGEYVRYFDGPGRRLLTGWFAAAGRYRELIEGELERMGAPRDLLWIVAIESAFNPAARSSAGAAGLWQFMERTGRSRGLRIDDLVDERLDPVRATRAAAQYLMYQYERFGSWPLAFAAYNAGSGHVRAEIREHNVTDFDALVRHDAIYDNARDYAARAIAIALIDRNREHFGFDGVVEDPAVQWDELMVDDAIRLSLIAEAAGVSTDELIALNPHLVEHVTPEGGYRVRIPPGTFARCVSRLDRLRERYGDEHELVELRFGESMDHFAARVGQPERVIRAVNGYSGRETVPYGEMLIVPTRGRQPSTQQERLSDEVVIVPNQRFSYPERHHLLYRVNGPDRLEEIAEFFGVGIWELATWNELDPAAALWGGMWLQVFVDPARDLGDAIVYRPEELRVLRQGSSEYRSWIEERERARRQTRTRTYEVQPGDTALGIALRFDIEVEDLIRWNDLNENAAIFAGQELIVGR